MREAWRYKSMHFAWVTVGTMLRSPCNQSIFCLIWRTAPPPPTSSCPSRKPNPTQPGSNQYLLQAKLCSFCFLFADPGCGRVPATTLPCVSKCSNGMFCRFILVHVALVFVLRIVIFRSQKWNSIASPQGYSVLCEFHECKRQTFFPKVNPVLAPYRTHSNLNIFIICSRCKSSCCPRSLELFDPQH
jgi:hypothetical protein